MMMVASLVVRLGCGTPLCLRAGKGGGMVDIEKNVENRVTFVMVLR